MYKFNKEKHIHTFNDKPLMGVTTILSVISKPALIQWSANMCIEHIVNNCKKELLAVPDGEIPDEIAYFIVTPEILEEAKFAHRKKKEKAGDWGTNVHLAIENWIKKNDELPKLDEKGFEVFSKFKKWAEDNKVEFLESEKNVWSEKLWIGGIVDLVFKMNGKKYIGDIKTSSGIYNEAFFQMGAYNLCLEEMGEHKDVDGYLVINLKKDGTIDMMIAEDMEINKKAFVSARDLWEIINKLNK
jgi:hypothetical protein